MRIPVQRAVPEPADHHVEARLFETFSLDGLGRKLAGLALAARKLPVARRKRSCGRIRTKKRPLAADDADAALTTGFTSDRASLFACTDWASGLARGVLQRRLWLPRSRVPASP